MLQEYQRLNFTTMLRAAEDGNLCIMECLDKTTNESSPSSVPPAMTPSTARSLSPPSP